MAYASQRTIRKQRCLVCDSSLEKSNLGSICNICKDKMGGTERKKAKKK